MPGHFARIFEDTSIHVIVFIPEFGIKSLKRKLCLQGSSSRFKQTWLLEIGSKVFGFQMAAGYAYICTCTYTSFGTICIAALKPSWFKPLILGILWIPWPVLVATCLHMLRFLHWHQYHRKTDLGSTSDNVPNRHPYLLQLFSFGYPMSRRSKKNIKPNVHSQTPLMYQPTNCCGCMQ